jgi:hypothetical protein
MYTYEIDGKVLTLHPRGTPTDHERRTVYDQIANDDRVPAGALVLLDARRVDPPENTDDLQWRAHTLVQRLGLKLGPACAVIVPPRLVPEGEYMQSKSSELGVKIALFRDEPEARKWLATFDATPDRR